MREQRVTRCNRKWLIAIWLGLSLALSGMPVHAQSDDPPSDNLVGPYGIAVDRQDNLYVVDIFNARILKFSPANKVLNRWGKEGNGEGEFKRPNDLALDSQGNLYVSDTGNNRIQKLDPNGKFLFQWGSYGTVDGHFNKPLSLATDSQDNLYVTDYANDRIQKFRSDGTFVTKWGSFGSSDGQFNGPFGVTVDNHDQVYVTDFANHRVEKFDSNGKYMSQWGSYGKGDGEFQSPGAITTDATGNVYVVDTGNDRIEKFDPNGKFLLDWTGQDWADGDNSDLNYNTGPRDLVIDHQNHLQLTNATSASFRIEKFGPNGNFLAKITGPYWEQDSSPTNTGKGIPAGANSQSNQSVSPPATSTDQLLRAALPWALIGLIVAILVWPNRPKRTRKP